MTTICDLHAFQRVMSKFQPSMWLLQVRNNHQLAVTSPLLSTTTTTSGIKTSTLQCRSLSVPNNFIAGVNKPKFYHTATTLPSLQQYPVVHNKERQSRTVLSLLPHNQPCSCCFRSTRDFSNDANLLNSDGSSRINTNNNDITSHLESSDAKRNIIIDKQSTGDASNNTEYKPDDATEISSSSSHLPSDVPTITGDDVDSDHSSFKIPGAQTGGGRKLAIVFTCTKCETRSIKQFTEKAYTQGVVLVRCPGCQNLHLIADRLGYFDDSKNWDIEALQPQKITDVMEIDLEVLLGAEKMQKLKEEALKEKEK